MAACDYCCEGAIRFCQMCETSEGGALHWEYIDLWHLQGCFPCDYESPTHEWDERTTKWFVDHMQPHGVNIKW